MKNTLLILLLSIAANAGAQNPKLLSYFKAHGGGACVMPYDSWKKYDSTKIGRPEGLFITTEEAMESIIQEAQAMGGGKTYSIQYIDSMLGTTWADNTTLVRFFISPQMLDSLHLRLPADSNKGANSLFISGGRTSGGNVEGFIDQVPLARLGSIPNYFGAHDNYEILVPSAHTISNNVANAPDQVFSKIVLSPIGLGWILVFIPLLLFFILIILFWKELRTLSLKDALSENALSTIMLENKEYSQANISALLTTMPGNPSIMANIGNLLPPTIEVSPGTITVVNIPPVAPATNVTSTTTYAPVENYRTSSARIIAFITSIVLLAIGFGLCSFYIYFYLSTGTAPDLSKLSVVLVALGIGMAPYAVNKITSAVANNKPNS